MIASIGSYLDHAHAKAAQGGNSESVGKMALKSQKTDGDKKLKEAAAQFEQVLIKQMLKPLEDSLSKAMGTESANPMIGSLVLDAVSSSIGKGGGLGFSEVIEKALQNSNPGLSGKSDK